ncbi:MAG: sigma-54-dependent Fis family transcriptional regulator [Acetobacteraceae bacterium]|nr:sigma-54-dependent Fis family transcriptional regulator [Acetobacteraceae bacterium]
MVRVLIIDDDAALRDSIGETLRDLGHTVVEAEDGLRGLQRLGEQPPIQAVLLDLRMPGLDGLEVLRRIRARADSPPVAVLTAAATAANTIEAMRLGAVGHLTKPIGRADIADLLRRMLPDAVAAIPQPSADPSEDGLVGNSSAMRDVQKAIGMLADSDATVLITGETGTGKEVVARAIHRHGRRAGKPFVAINCAAIPANLMESALFGHARGAFTGAIGDAKGSIREADGGTLLLDEIGDLDLILQAKLLRVLQEREVTPVGGKPVAVDVRVLAATHRDLPSEIRAGRFREDLYWRLGVVPLSLPPLRERRDDIVKLAEYFLARGAGRARGLTEAAGLLLRDHPWPGNVRELRNAIERVAVLARNPVVDVDDFSFLVGVQARTPEATDTMPEAVARLETEMIRRAIAASGGNRAEAARRLGVQRQLLYDKMRRYGLDLSAEATQAVGNPDT